MTEEKMEWWRRLLLGWYTEISDETAIFLLAFSLPIGFIVTGLALNFYFLNPINALVLLLLLSLTIPYLFILDELEIRWRRKHPR